MKNNKTNNVPIVEVEEIKVEETLGMVSNCESLRLREEPNTNSNILAILDAKTLLLIDSEGSTEDFYKVYTEQGLSGYCMKDYVSIQ